MSGPQTHSLDMFFDKAFQNPMETVQSTVNNPFAKMAANQLGSSLEKYNSDLLRNFSGLTDKYDSYLHKIFGSIHYYFDVDNSYVIKKITLCLAPYLHRGNWYESENSSAPRMGCQSPRDSVYAPDYYVPIMSMVTFILLKCLAIGLESAIHPSLIVTTFWKCIVVSFLELVLVKIVFCFMDGGALDTFDLVSHLNYRYVTLCAIVIIDIILNGYLYNFMQVYIFLCQAYFVYKTLQRYKVNSSQTLELNSFGSNIILILAIIQPLFSWIVLYFGI